MSVRRTSWTGRCAASPVPTRTRPKPTIRLWSRLWLAASCPSGMGSKERGEPHFGRSAARRDGGCPLTAVSGGLNDPACPWSRNLTRLSRGANPKSAPRDVRKLCRLLCGSSLIANALMAAVRQLETLYPFIRRHHSSQLRNRGGLFTPAGDCDIVPFWLAAREGD